MGSFCGSVDNNDKANDKGKFYQGQIVYESNNHTTSINTTTRIDSNSYLDTTHNKPLHTNTCIYQLYSNTPNQTNKDNRHPQTLKRMNSLIPNINNKGDGYKQDSYLNVDKVLNGLQRSKLKEGGQNPQESNLKSQDFKFLDSSKQHSNLKVSSINIRITSSQKKQNS